MTAELLIDSLQVGYGRRTVLHGLTCRFAPSRLSCILGPNGAGKTTLLRAITGLLPISAGSVYLHGTSLLSLTPRERARRVALVPQLAAETIPLNVREAVALARYARRGAGALAAEQDASAVQSALESLAIAPLAGEPCSAISGGEWRRVLIAQGLAQQSDVLLLDEPTAFLDPPARVYVMEKLRDLAHGNGLIIAVVLHDPELALRYGDDAVMLREGRAVACGQVADVVTGGLLSQLYDSPLNRCEVRKEYL